MKVLMISILAMLPMFSIAHNEHPIFQEWKSLKKDVHKHLFNNNYDKAIESSRKLLGIDPSNDEAKFLFLFTYIQSGKQLPDWTKNEIRFSNTDAGSFYKAVFEKLDKSN